MAYQLVFRIGGFRVWGYSESKSFSSTINPQPDFRNLKRLPRLLMQEYVYAIVNPNLLFIAAICQNFRSLAELRKCRAFAH